MLLRTDKKICGLKISDIVSPEIGQLENVCQGIESLWKYVLNIFARLPKWQKNEMDILVAMSHFCT